MTRDLNVLINFYQFEVGRTPSFAHRKLCKKMLENGIECFEILAAILSASIHYGPSGTESEYWKYIRQFCRKKWKEKKRKGLLDL